MKKYGFINNLGELKLIQNSIYKGSGKFVGITRNGGAFIHTGTESRQLTRDEIRTYLNLTPEQVDSVIRSRGKVDFDLPKGDGNFKPTSIEKFENTQQVRVENKDTLAGREMSITKASVDDSNEVNLDQGLNDSVSLGQSEIKSLSLKNQVKYLRNRVKWFEENYVSKEQMIEIMQAILQEK